MVIAEEASVPRKVPVVGAARDGLAVAATVTHFGRLDILLNNAGIGGLPGTIEETTSELWDTMMDINAKGVFLGTKAAIPEMRKVGGGSHINISSIWGIVGSDGSSSYHPAKGAVRLLTKSTVIQYAGEGIRANSVHPGPIAAPMTEANSDRNQWFLANTPLGRWGEPDNVAYRVLFLASDESSFMNGSELVIYAGWTAQ